MYDIGKRSINIHITTLLLLSSPSSPSNPSKLNTIPKTQLGTSEMVFSMSHRSGSSSLFGSSHQCGCYYIVPSNSSSVPASRLHLPLLDSEAHSTILSTTSKTVLKQTFSNPSNSEAIKECTYTFPLYDGVSVVGFTCTIGPRTLRGIVKEKVRAKKIFDDAVAKGETAGLLMQAPEASDVFSTKLGNIPAGEKVIVEITYIGELKHDDADGIRFTIPTSIAPRYGAGPNTSKSLFSSLRGFSNQSADAGRICITVDVNLPEGLSIKSLQSPSHPIAVSMGVLSVAAQADPVMNKASATLSLGSSALEKDFVFIVHSKGTGIPKALLETHPTIPNHRALMTTLVPRFSLPHSKSEIVFIADRSGSMMENIPMLISAMRVFLKSIPTGIKFNICSFGSNHAFLWHKSKSYTSENLREAMEYVSTFEANFGGTETFNAIKATVENRLGDLPLEIILLTDGDIWNQEPLFAYVNKQVKKTQGNIRVFPLGIGIGVSHSLIGGLARAGNGFAQAVQHGERLDNNVVRMLRGALTPHITDYTLEVKYEQEDDDFEVIEKVTDCMKMLRTDSDSSSKMLLHASEPVGSGMKIRLSDRDLIQSQPSQKKKEERPEEKPEEKPQAVISLFDPNVNPEIESIDALDEKADLPNIQHPKLLQSPHKIPSLVPFSRTTVYLLLGPETIQRNPTSVVLRATCPHGPLAIEIPVEVLSERDQTIHQLAARKASQDLEESRGWVYDGELSDKVLIKDKYPGKFDAIIEKEAVRLGETFQVANKWCSFVAVSSNDDGVEITTPMESEKAEVLQQVQDSVSTEIQHGIPHSRSSPSAFGFGSIFHSRRSSSPSRDMLQSPPLPSFALHQQTSMFGASAAPPAKSMLGGFGSAAAHATTSQSGGLFGSMQSNSQSSGGDTRSQGSGLFGAPAGFGSAATHTRTSQSGGLFGSMQSNSQSTGGDTRSQGSSLFGVSSPPGSSLFSNFRNNTMTTMQSQAADSDDDEEDDEYEEHEEDEGGEAEYMEAPKARKQSQPLPPRQSGHPRFYKAGPPTSFAGFQPPPPTSLFSPSKPVVAQAPSHNVQPPNPVIKTDADKVLAIIDLQAFDGSWDPKEKTLVSLLGLKTIPNAPEGVDSKAWITCLVIAFLENKMSNEEGMWELVVEKARGFVEGVMQEKSVEEIEKMATDIITKN